LRSRRPPVLFPSYGCRRRVDHPSPGSRSRSRSMLTAASVRASLVVHVPCRYFGQHVLMAFYSIRSERQLCERLRYDLKWFLGRPCRGKLVASRRRPPCWRGPARRLSFGPSEKS